MNAECYICDKELPTDTQYYSLSRMIYHKLDGSCWNDEIQYSPMPTAVLVACESCMGLLSTGSISHSGKPYKLLDIEENRLAKCFEDITHGQDEIPDARTCENCDQNIEVESIYMRIHLSLEIVREDDTVKPLSVTSIAILCDECSEIGRILIK